MRKFDVHVKVTLEKDYYGLTEGEVNYDTLVADTRKRGWKTDSNVEINEIDE